MTTKDVVTGRCLRNPCMSCMWALKVSQKFHDIHVRGSIKVNKCLIERAKCNYHKKGLSYKGIKIGLKY